MALVNILRGTLELFFTFVIDQEWNRTNYKTRKIRSAMWNVSLALIIITILWVFRIPSTRGFVVVPNNCLFTRFLALNDSQMSRKSSCSLFCQLLGMNAARESDIGLSWPDFCERGGKSDVHADGWGMSYYNGNGLRQFHDVEPASTSALAAFLANQTIHTRNLLAHIRYATTGGTHLANVHPFSREMWALHWCFCHNGQIPLFEDHPDHMLGSGFSDERFYYPVGDTDSEMAFCAILNALRAEFTDTMPSLPVLYEKLQSLCHEIVNYDPQRTILNFLLTGGPHVLWVYSWPGQRPGSSVWNGLHYSVRSQNVAISDEDVTMNVKIDNSVMCIVATKPMTDDEEWIELKPGELIVFDNGIPHVTPAELFRIELQGHGLNNEGKVLRPPRLEEDMRRFALHPAFFVGGGI